MMSYDVTNVFAKSLNLISNNVKKGKFAHTSNLSNFWMEKSIF